MKPLDLENNKAVKKDPFQLPDGYFENFTTHLMEKIPIDEPQVKTTVQPFKTIIRRFKPVIYAAAVISGIIFGIQTYKFQTANDSQTSTEEHETEITAQEANNYINDFWDKFQHYFCIYNP